MIIWPQIAVIILFCITLGTSMKESVRETIVALTSIALYGTILYAGGFCNVLFR